MTIELFLSIAVVGVTILSVLGMRAAYRNGVMDGFGFSKEPMNPGYKLAGEYLRKTVAHRWPSLLEDGDK